MTTLTVQVEEYVMEKAKQLAALQTATLDKAVASAIVSAPLTPLRGLEADDSPVARGRRWDAMMQSMGHLDAGRPYTRDELNER